MFITSSNQKSPITIWLMRQAGRYLPEYQQIRSSVSNFLELCYNSDLAFEVAMQPMNRFNLDAAILFSDILVIPDAMGYNVQFIQNKGPILNTITLADIKNLDKKKFDDLLNKLSASYATISKLKQALDKKIIGFCGAPWTVATYMIKGGPSTDHGIARTFGYKYENYLLKLLDYLSEISALYLIEQIKAGAEIVQIFDSWAGILSYDEFEKYCINPTKNMVNIIRSSFPNISIIGFPKGANCFLDKFVDLTNISALSVDWCVDYEILVKLQRKVVVQGNLDPLILVEGGKLLENKVEEIIKNLKHKNFIFNLGHGILPQTPIEHVSYLVEKVHSYNV